MQGPPRVSKVSAFAIAVAATLAPGCDDGPLPAPPPDTRPLVVLEGCQPLLAEPPGEAAPPTSTCLAPYPSDFHRAPDASSPTGFTTRLRGAARPSRRDGQPSDPHDVARVDGASLISTVVGALPGDVLREGLPGVLEDPTKSALPSSPTVLLDTATGKLVAHYTDIVDRKDGAHTPIVVRTFAPLAPRTRYVVAFKGVLAASGAGATPKLAKPPSGFARLRDRAVANDPTLAALETRFDAEVFGPLERAGVARSDLQLAWDFTTGSADDPSSAMLRMRELTMAWARANDPDPKVVATRPGSAGSAIDTVLTVEMTAPLFLVAPGPASRLFRDANGAIAQNGTTRFRVTVVVPKSIATRSVPGRALAYGHGFFGDTTELEGDAALAIADRTGSVLFGTEWWGMSKDDFVSVADALTNAPEHVADFAERVHQAMANWIVLTHALHDTASALGRIPALHRGGQLANPLLWDPSFVAYFGASQGHILGGTLAALDPDFSRVVLNVGGGGFTHMMPRSLNFGPFGLLLAATYPDPLLVQSFIAMYQRPLDRIDPVTYAPLVLGAPLAGSTPDRRVLFQTGLGDAQVPNAGAFLHARAMGLAMTMPTPLAVFGIPAAQPGATSAMTLFDYHIDVTGSALGQPLEPNPVHGSVRTNPKALAQMEAFVKPDSVVIAPCDGPCDPE